MNISCTDRICGWGNVETLATDEYGCQKISFPQKVYCNCVFEYNNAGGEKNNK